MTVRAAIYLRISQDANEDGLAVSRQRESCLSIAAARGWTVVEEFADTVSASKRNVARPSYDRLYAAFEAGQFDALVCWDLDRLTRQPRQLEDWVDLAETRSVLIATATGEADLTTDNGRMFARIKATVARGEIEAKGRRQRAKNLQNAAAGKPVPGRRRFGYKPGNIEPDETEAAIVRELFRAIQDRESVRSLAAKYGHTLQWVRQVVKNKAYAGYVMHRGVYSETPGAIVPIVTLEEWQAANLILADPTRRTSHTGPDPKHLMSGIALCGVCGSRMHFSEQYRCQESGAHAIIVKGLLEKAVSDAVFAWAVGDVDIEPTDSARLTALLAELADTEAQRAVQEELYALPGASKARVAKRLAALGAEADRLTRAIDEERAGEAMSGVLRTVRTRLQVPRPEEFSEAHEPIWRGLAEMTARNIWPDYWASLSIEEQRGIVRALLTVTVQKGRGAERVRIEYV